MQRKGLYSQKSHEIPFYRKSNFITFLSAISFFVPFASIIPMFLLLSGDIYQISDETYKVYPVKTKRKMFLMLTLITIIFLIVIFYEKGFLIYQWFLSLLLVMASLAAVYWQVKKKITSKSHLQEQGKDLTERNEALLVKKGEARVKYVITSMMIFSISSQVLEAAAGTHTSIDASRLVLTVCLLYFLYKRHRWAKIITTFLTSATAALVLYYIVTERDLTVRVVSSAILIWLCSALYFLVLSKEVKAYFNQERNN